MERAETLKLMEDAGFEPIESTRTALYPGWRRK